MTNGKSLTLAASALAAAAIVVSSGIGSAAFAAKCSQSIAKGTWTSTNFAPNEEEPDVEICTIAVDGKGKITGGSCLVFPKGRRSSTIAGTIKVSSNCKVVAELSMRDPDDGTKWREKLKGTVIDDGKTLSFPPAPISRFRKQF